MGREKGFVFMETHKKGASFNDRFLSIGSMRVDVLLIINQGIVYACLLSFRL